MRCAEGEGDGLTGPRTAEAHRRGCRASRSILFEPLSPSCIVYYKYYYIYYIILYYIIYIYICIRWTQRSTWRACAAYSASSRASPAASRSRSRSGPYAPISSPSSIRLREIDIYIYIYIMFIMAAPFARTPRPADLQRRRHLHRRPLLRPGPRRDAGRHNKHYIHTHIYQFASDVDPRSSVTCLQLPGPPPAAAREAGRTARSTVASRRSSPGPRVGPVRRPDPGPARPGPDDMCARRGWVAGPG